MINGGKQQVGFLYALKTNRELFSKSIYLDYSLEVLQVEQISRYIYHTNWCWFATSQTLTETDTNKMNVLHDVGILTHNDYVTIVSNTLSVSVNF